VLGTWEEKTWTSRVTRENKGLRNDTVTALRGGWPDAETEVSVMAEIRDFNAANEAHEDLWARTRQAADLVCQAIADGEKPQRARRAADMAYKTAQAEHPDRRAPRFRQWLIAALALALDAVACLFAAEALGGSMPETLVWAALFLAVLGSGELALDHYRETHRTVSRWIAGIVSAFIVLLGVLRFHSPGGHSGRRGQNFPATRLRRSGASLDLAASAPCHRWPARQGVGQAPLE
jgi:hypothetical protein